MNKNSKARVPQDLLSSSHSCGDRLEIVRENPSAMVGTVVDVMIVGVGEIVQWLRVFVLAGDVGSVLSTHMCHTRIYKSSSWGPDTLF